MYDKTLHNSYSLELNDYCSLPFFDNNKVERYIDFKMKNETLPWADIITFVDIGLDFRFYTDIKTILKPESLTVLVNKHYRLSKDYIPQDLEVISPDCSIEGLQLRQEARIFFEKMCKTAKKDGIILKAISTYRSYTYQEQVYYRKKTPDMSIEDYQKERDKVSARAGHSEHQTGLAVDINDLEETFELTPEGKWLAANSYLFGYILRYPKEKEYITGYSYEPWHFRYVGLGLAEAVTYSGLTYDEYYIRYQLQSCCN